MYSVFPMQQRKNCVNAAAVYYEFIYCILSKINTLFSQQLSVKRAADTVGRVWLLTNVSVHLDSQEVTARKVI